MTSDGLDDLRAITDPVERARRATEIIDGSTAVITAASAIRQEAIERLRATMTHSAIAEATGLTRARVSQLLGSARPERALLAPDPGDLTIAVVQKKDPDSGQPVIGSTTRKALAVLCRAAGGLGIPAGEEEIPAPGMIDLNRGNLAVLMGPRTSALIAQAISADPAIRWATDGRGRWYLTDPRTGREYHSDFDAGWDAAAGERACYAHVGRIRRPDGRGTFLYLGGMHSPGTAGAVAWLVRDMPAIWEQVKRSPMWSGIIRTVAADDGTPASCELVTPLYAHGKR